MRVEGRGFGRKPQTPWTVQRQLLVTICFFAKQEYEKWRVAHKVAKKNLKAAKNSQDKEASTKLVQDAFDKLVEWEAVLVRLRSTVGLFCLYSRSLLPLQQVSFASTVGLFCLYSRSLLPLQ